MKNTFIILALFLAVSLSNAQTLSENYQRKIPALPKDSCNITRIDVENFQQKVSIVISEIENEIEILKAAEDEQTAVDEQTAKATAMQQMSQQYNLSPQQMAQMKAGKMADADKQALANQILQQQTNMSMGEVQNLSKMSDAGKKAYAEAYATEIQATQQANPGQQPANAGANLQQLIMQQQAVMGKINASALNIGNAYNAIESDPNLQKMLKNIDNWQSKIMSMSGIVSDRESKKMDSLSVLIKTAQIKICQNYTPKYRSAIRNHYAQMKASFPYQQKLGEIVSEMTRMQTGLAPPSESVEIGKLESIKGYLNKLSDAYRFKMYYSEDN